jgi:hypothetical protein
LDGGLDEEELQDTLREHEQKHEEQLQAKPPKHGDAFFFGVPEQS